MRSGTFSGEQNVAQGASFQMAMRKILCYLQVRNVVEWESEQGKSMVVPQCKRGHNRTQCELTWYFGFVLSIAKHEQSEKAQTCREHRHVYIQWP